MMKVLFIDYCCNAVDMAMHLAKSTAAVDKIYVMATMVDEVVWGHDKIEYVSGHTRLEPLTNEQICHFAKEQGIDLVINFNTIYGSAGIVEQLEAEGIQCIGSNQSFSDLETNKRQFKHWLIEKGFKTPAIQFEGLYKDIEARMEGFSYPLVIKPDSQVGPQVATCHNPDELKSYLEKTASLIPYAKFGIVFIIEDYIPSRSVGGIAYCLCGGKAYLCGSMELVFDTKTDLNMSGGVCAIAPSPSFMRFEDTLQSLVDQMVDFGDCGVGNLECLLSRDGELYIIENNSRPSVQKILDGVSMMDFLIGLRDRNHHLVEKTCSDVFDSKETKVSLALLHADETYEVNYEELHALVAGGGEYLAYSVSCVDGKYISSHGRIPSIIGFKGGSLAEAIENMESAFATLSCRDDFVGLNTQVLKRFMSENPTVH